jgi:hypothetical protein
VSAVTPDDGWRDAERYIVIAERAILLAVLASCGSILVARLT